MPNPRPRGNAQRYGTPRGGQGRFCASAFPPPQPVHPGSTALKRTAVRFGWSAVSFAEIRDLNRHRTGTKYSPQLPIGFYFALEQLPGNDQGQAARPRILEQAQVGMNTTRTALNHLKNGDPSYVFWAVLGTQFPFEHTTTADKFIYEAELRTGVGAHFRYAKHLRDVLAIWYERYPETKSLIPHKKVIFLSEPDERLKRAAEMTFWFELYLDRAAPISSASDAPSWESTNAPLTKSHTTPSTYR